MYRIDYHKVIIVLSGKNRELDRQVLICLPDFMKRKYADRAIVFCKKDQIAECRLFLRKSENISVKIIEMTYGEMKLLYSFYCFMKFFDNIVFTHTDEPEDNPLGKYLNETEIDEEDAACLALYHLRYVPGMREKRG